MSTTTIIDAPPPGRCTADHQPHLRLTPVLGLPRRLAVVGAFGSGKTEIALNAALRLADHREPVALIDLDAVTPALRSRQARRVLDAAGVELLAPPGGLAYADLPAVSAAVRAALSRRGRRLLVDVGGHPEGARALGSLRDLFASEEHALLGVVCPWRPQTRDARAIEKMLKAVGSQAGLSVAAMAVNFHVPGQPRAADLRDAEAVALEAAARLGARLALYAIEDRYLELGREALGADRPWLGLELFMRAPWDEAWLGADNVWQSTALPAPQRRLVVGGG